MIWQKTIDISTLNSTRQKNLVNHLGIKFTNYGDDYLEATMPVDERTVQPYGILHGGASVVLAETIGSVASNLCLSNEGEIPVGIEINANHLKSVKSGFVTGKASPIRIGRTLHVWNIEIRNQRNELICVSRLTTMIIERR